MSVSRILAVDHLHLEARPGVTEELVWFYSEVAELEPTEEFGPSALRLCFKSGQIELRIDILEDATIEMVASRARILVSSLVAARRLLDEKRIAYETLFGLTFTDRRIGVQDPAGNRVELRQEWPLLTL